MPSHGDQVLWGRAALVVAVGALVLGTGLLLGPTPGNEPEQALRDIAAFRGKYILTNVIDLVGILIMASGLIAFARLQLVTGGGALAVVGGAANVSGGALIVLTLVLQSTVEPTVAERFAHAGAADRPYWLALGETVITIDGAVFGTAFLLQMAGIALVAVTFLNGAGPRVNRWFLTAGAFLATGASTMGIAALFEDVFGEVEAVLGLLALLWLVVLSILLARTEHAFGRGTA